VSGQFWLLSISLALSRVEREIREAEQEEERGTALVPRGQKKNSRIRSCTGVRIIDGTPRATR